MWGNPFWNQIESKDNKIISEERTESISIQKFHKLVADHKKKTDDYIRRTALGAFTVDVTACEKRSQAQLEVIEDLDAQIKKILERGTTAVGATNVIPAPFVPAVKSELLKPLTLSVSEANITHGHPASSVRSTSTRASSAALRKRAEASAAQAALEYARKEADMEIQKAELHAKLTLLNFEREAAKAAAGALIYENAKSSNHSMISKLQLPSENKARRTAEYVATSPAPADGGQPWVEETSQPYPMAFSSSATHD